MSEIVKKSHQEFAVALFNRTWDLIDKMDRSAAETDEMIHAAHASRYHWGEAGEGLHWQRGEWLISRVYAIIKHPEACLYHAQRCMALTEEHAIGGFDLAFAHEALARAYALLDDRENMQKHLDQGRQTAEKVADEGDRQYTLSELDSIKLTR
jgi:hypothetical protein